MACARLHHNNNDHIGLIFKMDEMDKHMFIKMYYL